MQNLCLSYAASRSKVKVAEDIAVLQTVFLYFVETQENNSSTFRVKKYLIWSYMYADTG